MSPSKGGWALAGLVVLLFVVSSLLGFKANAAAVLVQDDACQEVEFAWLVPVAPKEGTYSRTRAGYVRNFRGDILEAIKEGFGTYRPGHPGDLNEDGVVGGPDLAKMRSHPGIRDNVGETGDRTRVDFWFQPGNRHLTNTCVPVVTVPGFLDEGDLFARCVGDDTWMGPAILGTGDCQP